MFNVWTEFKIDPEQLAAWQKNRRGCVVDRRLADEKGWKIGERIPLKGTYYPYDLDLEMVGMFDTPKPTGTLWFHWDYLDEGLKQKNAINRRATPERSSPRPSQRVLFPACARRSTIDTPARITRPARRRKPRLLRCSPT